MDDQRVKPRALDERIPRRGDLREYLAQKDETASVAVARAQPHLVRCRPIPDPRTLLVMPPMCLYEGAVKRVIPPLGLCYIAASMERAGLNVAILDCIVEGVGEVEQVAPGVWRFGLSEERFRDLLRAQRFDIVGLSMIYSSDLHHLYRCAQIVKEMRPETVVIAGGLHATIYTRRFLQDAVREGVPLIDFVIRGEGELRMPALVSQLSQGCIDLRQDGLAGWWQGELFVNPQREQIADLDSLALPAYHRVPLEKYFAHNVPFSPYPRGKRVMQIYTSRGCPIGCAFCASTNFAKAFRARSVDAVISEIRTYQELYQIDEIQFADDNLTLDRTRALELFTRMEALGIPWCTPNGIMVNTLDTALLDRMIAAGMYQITLSVDSGSAKTLRERHRKPVDLLRLPKLMAHLEARGILIHGTLVVGMPGESQADIEEGFRFVEGLPFHSMNVFIAQAIPGSELFERELHSGAVSYDSAQRIDTSRSTLRLSHLGPRELEATVEDFLSRFNKSVRERDPAAWQLKYGAHARRFRDICVGAPAPNTARIFDVHTSALPGV